jgi:type IV pilus assembly protein PilB
MGVDPYLIAPTLKLAIAQRLSRRLHNNTGEERPVDPATRMMIEETFKTLPEKYRHRIPEIKSILHPKPSPQSATGLSGRTAVSEILEITDEIQELILRNAPEDEFFKAARKNGFVSLHEDAIIKALKHEIPYEEMNVFRSKVGMGELLEEDIPPVDNQPVKSTDEAIIEVDEATTS